MMTTSIVYISTVASVVIRWYLSELAFVTCVRIPTKCYCMFSNTMVIKG